MQKEVNIIGAGLAGCEAAYLLAENGVKVNLFEVKSLVRNEIQKTNDLAELVCSNTLRSKSKKNAAGILKNEMEMLNSLVIKAAYENQIPGDDALSVDRFGFSKYITQVINNHKNINLFNQEVTKIDYTKVTIIASGPLTTEKLGKSIEYLTGNEKLFFLDASAPIITKESIDFNRVYWASRHNDGKHGQYICIPLNMNEFEAFVEELKKAETITLKSFEKEVYFKGCQPIEQIAKTSKKVLLNGPLSPNNLYDLNNEIPYAVVQLRQDDAIDSLYNFVGFQTNIKWPEQKRILSTLPGLEKCNIVRYGVMHKNYYINSPKLLNRSQQVKRNKNIFFAGQITGVEGYIESASSGILAAINVLAYLNNVKIEQPSRKTMLGALNFYITNPKHEQLKPMKCNLGILDQKNKNSKSEFYSFEQSEKEMKNFIKKISKIIKIGEAND
ncbi:FADH(2)-oxidizing methylenetetrahydrofolate--tRNA-(uracil(54)-C(5))-methyltransferase TrmFO [Mesoplasma chauliocola]|uniref:Methylenetetrahydrofolate--tRNA-(uracil-5-)-methyltransferase TrmFO n=1 Tax=Mesoplasma chauliocola TaxID=216427 RepID=A0A249SND3_9MOLU|nr:methylenetetrahydrofolate--tRNA-(uracil(54)-C(5))-methyltransferase (FADH(2)-oxidizing) TrmFO [Mesoplasma chauliocola]ASZ09001.1 FADH(2)-oxidizing methylenetetrahydrofolate--tRNA-(uracil(54)-C(5))-methyltransferase TrmFO [Mesoplasma chauliocola]